MVGQLPAVSFEAPGLLSLAISGVQHVAFGLIEGGTAMAQNHG